MTTETGAQDAAHWNQAWKTEMVQEAVDHIRVAGHILTPMAVRVLERLYDRAEEAGRQRGIAQAGIALGASLAPDAPSYRKVILNALDELPIGSPGLKLDQLVTRCRMAGWDVSRTDVRRELEALTEARLVLFNLHADEHVRWLPVRDGT